MNQKHHNSTFMEDLEEARIHAVARPWARGTQEAWERSRPRPWLRWVDYQPTITDASRAAFSEAKRPIERVREERAEASPDASGRNAWRASLARKRWEAGKAKREAERELRLAQRRASWTPEQWAARDRYLAAKARKEKA